MSDHSRWLRTHRKYVNSIIKNSQERMKQSRARLRALLKGGIRIRGEEQKNEE